MKPQQEFQFHRNYEHSFCKPCIKNRCTGFMFLVLTQYSLQGPVWEEYECFTCYKSQRLRKIHSGKKR